jgi:AmmeMemoRadiSam system protein A/AmmeMemoRadiSam system protein B
MANVSRNTGSVVFAGIAPHPPIMVPEVGGDAITEVQRSIAAMAEFTRRIIDTGAQTVVLISPHAPLEPRSFVAYHSTMLRGDFANFRAPDTLVEFPLDTELLDAIATTAAEEEFTITKLDERYQLDHGSAVPLYFLDRNGWFGNVVALGYSFLGNHEHLQFGASIKRAADRSSRRIAFVASGDLSHRLKPDAPAGFNPVARLFDEEVVKAIEENAPERIAEIDQDLRRLAGECGYRSMLVALGVIETLPRACEVLNYEGPFGVGYLVAQLTKIEASERSDKESGKAEVSLDDAQDLPKLARRAIETFVRTGKHPEVNETSPLSRVRAACFVSIKTKAGDLRGCIGTVEPSKQSLAEELVVNAINAATRDPRFSPVTPDELPDLSYSVDVLAPPEATSFEDLDPSIYGVIVEDDSGFARGLLLPDIEGVDTVEKQVEIASRKAGIAPGQPVKLSRFKVERYREK